MRALSNECFFDTGLNAVFATIPIVGSLMLTLRVAGSERKAMANGIVTLSVTLFGMLPGPPIVGTIVDSTCALWSSDACDSSADGNCLFFDTDQLRIRLLSFVAALRLITAGVDLFVSVCNRAPIVSITMVLLHYDRYSSKCDHEISSKWMRASRKPTRPTATGKVDSRCRPLVIAVATRTTTPTH